MSSIILSVITVIWFFTGLFFSHQRGAQTYETSIRLARWLCEFAGRAKIEALSDIEAVNIFLRRGAHCFIFMVFAALMCTSLMLLKNQHSWKIPPWAGFIFSLICCWADEASKIWVDGRHFSWFDTALNAAGCLMGGIIYILIRFTYSKRTKKRQKTLRPDTGIQ